jgi:hypothetical protein
MDTATASQITGLLDQYKSLSGADSLADWADRATRVLRAAHSAGENWIDGRDAAFPANLHGWGGAVFGYYGGPLAYNVWTVSDWRAFGGYKIPMWVGGYAGEKEGHDAVSALETLGVPEGCETVLDMETRVDRTYVEHFGMVLQAAGYKVLVYGSTSTLFKNPQLNGYAVSDPTGVAHMYPHPGVRMTQYAFGQVYDRDVIKQWIASDGHLWR